MSTNDAVSKYYSGQGVVMIANRDAVTGLPQGFVPVGNVSDLKITVNTSVLEHKESQSGQRAIDLRLTTETKAALSMTMESFSMDNLRIALRATPTALVAGTVTGEAAALYFGKVSALAKIKASAVVVKRGATTLTAYTTPTAAYDYKVNGDAGSITMNDGQGTALLAAATTLGTACATPFVAVSGSKVTFTFAARPPTAAVGGKLAPVLVTGADAAFVNSKAWPITAVTATTVEIEIGVTGKTLTGAATTLCVADGDALTVDYSYAAQNVVDALTEGATERYLRFEGLNTADNSTPVVVEVFKFSTDPLKELALIGDGIGQFVLEGNVLADNLRTSGSKFFKQTSVA